MMTNPTLDNLLEGLIVSLENEIMPHVSSPKAHVMCQMVQSLIQEVRQALPVYDTYVAEEHNQMTQVLRDVAAALGDSAKVIKIDVEKNQELAEALRVKTLPTLIIYKDGEMKWRQSGEQDANTLIGIIQEYV